MRKTSSYLIVLLCLIGFGLCCCTPENVITPDVDDGTVLVVDSIKPDNPMVYAQGGNVVINISSNRLWNYSLLQESDSNWVRIERCNDSLSVTTLKNLTNVTRSAGIRICSGKKSVDLEICQFPDIIKRTALKERRIKNYLTVSYDKMNFARLVFVLPVPQSNMYQDVTQLNYRDADLLTTSDGELSYIRKNYENGFPQSGEICIYEDFALRSYTIKTDFSAIKSYIPINRESDVYKKYTVADGDYIVPDNPEIQSVADKLWSEAKEDIITYARLCYEHVAKTLLYLYPGTGLYPLSDILKNGGGDCGNQASVYISLLRNKGIPARHVVMIRTDNTFHVRSEFFLAGYGWIPVDVNAKNFDARGDYFGKTYSDEIVMNTDVNIDVMLDSTESGNIALLQTYACWYWWTAPCNVTFNLVTREY